MVLPTPPVPWVTEPDFVVVSPGAEATVGTVVWGDEPDTVVPFGVRAEAVAVLRTLPASTSAWVMV